MNTKVSYATDPAVTASTQPPPEPPETDTPLAVSLYAKQALAFAGLWPAPDQIITTDTHTLVGLVVEALLELNAEQLTAIHWTASSLALSAF